MNNWDLTLIDQISLTTVTSVTISSFLSLLLPSTSLLAAMQQLPLTLFLSLPNIVSLRQNMSI